jgi:hypothetical protein
MCQAAALNELNITVQFSCADLISSTICPNVMGPELLAPGRSFVACMARESALGVYQVLGLHEGNPSDATE